MLHTFRQNAAPPATSANGIQIALQGDMRPKRLRQPNPSAPPYRAKPHRRRFPARKAHSPCSVAARGKPMMFACGTRRAHLRHNLFWSARQPIAQTALRKSRGPTIENLHRVRACLQLPDQMLATHNPQADRSKPGTPPDRDRPIISRLSVHRRPCPLPDSSPESTVLRKNPAAMSQHRIQRGPTSAFHRLARNRRGEL